MRQEATTESATQGGKSLLPAALLGAALVGTAAQFGLRGQTQTLVIHLGLVALIGTALAAAVLRSRQSAREASGWRLLSASLFITGLIQASRLPTFLGHPLPGQLREVSIALQVLSSLLPVGTLLSWHLNPVTRFDRVRHGLDGLLFALAVFFILWALVLGPAFFNDRFPLAERLTWLGTFLVYDLLLGLAIYFGLAQPSRFRGPLGWLALAFLLASIHNFKWLMDVLTGTTLFHLPTGALIYLVPLSYLAAALSPRPVDAQDTHLERARFLHLLPYVPVLGATALGIWMLATGTGPGHKLILVWLALSLLILLLVRQYFALRDFFHLSQYLELRVAERTQALETAQAMLLRTERMNAMATLGAGLAHDMNNLLGAIQNRADLVLTNMDQGLLPTRKDMVRVLEATQTVASMSSRLMAMGRQEPLPPQELDLSKELHALQPLLLLLLSPGQTLHLEAMPGPMPFLGTRGMLEQILVNLVSNARDAMPEGGSVTIRARPPRPDEEGCGPLLEIEDTGTGIPLDLQDRVFQPFFTTKTSGIGTGIGLASVKSLLEKTGGSIQFLSQDGQGTAFQVRLPRLP